jgi:hypothetical protein
MKDPTAQYLARHAEPEAALAGKLPGSFGHALVIPAYGERESLFSLLGSVPGGPGGPVLIVLVLNARADSPRAVHETNEEVRKRLAKELAPAAGLSPELPARAYSIRGGTLLLVDRALPDRFLPEGQGVGLARKIGNDLVLVLRAGGRVASPWIHNTDADTVLPNDYFEQTAALDPEGTGAAIYAFEHRFDPDPAQAEAARLYEISLRYNVLGLAWADSPYAYHSMGSCLAIPAKAYAQVRGFPKRNALEDFHALNKLAKVGRILRLTGQPLLLEGRISERVPISTGKAIAGLVSRRGALAGFQLYHPAVFAHLAAWLRVLGSIARSRGDTRAPLAELPADSPFFRTDLLLGALEEIGAFRAIREAIPLSSDETTLLRHLHTWFDALRTVQLIHALRDGGLPSTGWLQALAEAPFAGLTALTGEDPENLRQALIAEEKKLGETPAGLCPRPAFSRADPWSPRSSG